MQNLFRYKMLLKQEKQYKLGIRFFFLLKATAVDKWESSNTVDITTVAEKGHLYCQIGNLPKFIISKLDHFKH